MNAQPKLVALWMAMIVVGSGLIPTVARADSAAVANASLPSGRYGTSAVWNGTHGFVFGGWGSNGYLSQIVRYDPAADAVATMGAPLPSGRTGASAVWDGIYAYLFGGWNGATTMNQIVRYHPATDTLTVMAATLPTPRKGTSAVWDGQYAYVFGGWTGSSYSNQILRYDPVGDAIAVLAATLPSARGETSAVWNGQSAYIFGGAGGGFPLDQIVRYTPSTNAVTVMSAKLPSGRHSMATTWDGLNAYLLGGWDTSLDGELRDILRYTPATDSLTAMSAQLPSKRQGASAVYDGRSAYAFGGWGGTHLDEVVHYQLAPGAPQNLVAKAGPAPHQVTLQWQPPASNTFSYPLREYFIYRATDATGPYFRVGVVGNVLTFLDTPPAEVNFYHVSATNMAGEGSPSNAAVASGILALDVNEEWAGDSNRRQVFVPTDDQGRAGGPGAGPAPGPGIDATDPLDIPRLVPSLDGPGNGTLLFADSFETNPATNGAWTTYRHANDAANEAAWDQANHRLYLTRSNPDRAAAIVASQPLTDHAWEAQFTYRSGGGTGGEGFTFFFYKDTSSYASGVGAAASLGFQGASTTPGLEPPIAGYGVAFDSLATKKVLLVEDTATNALGTAVDPRVNDNTWHQARVRYDEGHVEVSVDSVLVLNCVLATPDYAYRGVGFSASTGLLADNHLVDDFTLRRLTSPAGLSTRPDPCPLPVIGPMAGTMSPPAGPQFSPCEAGQTLAQNPACDEDLLADLVPQGVSVTSKGDQLVVLANVHNAGASPASTFIVDLTVLDATGIIMDSQRQTVSRLSPGETTAAIFPWILSQPGAYHLNAIVDASNLVPESEETRNQAALVHHVTLPLGLAPHDYVRFQRDLQGLEEHATPAEVQLVGHEELRLLPAGSRTPVHATVYWPWAEQVFGRVAAPANYRLINRDGGVWALITDTQALRGLRPALTAAVSELPEGFSYGSLQTVWFAERPMQVSIAESPGRTLLTQPAQTPNGTVLRTLQQAHSRLGIRFDDGNRQGQPVWINRAWLSTMGFQRPVFEHEDGARIPYETTATHLILHPAHFSVIYVRDDDGTAEATYRFDYGDDAATKRLPLATNALTGALRATLRIQARAASCGSSGNAFRLSVNGYTTTDLNPCVQWDTVNPSWASFDVPLSQLVAGSNNTISLQKTSTNWADRNLNLYLDRSNDYARSDAVENNVDQPGELLWYLEIAQSDTNNAANPCFTTDPSIGTTSATFNVDASCTADDATPSANLLVRWDWENDGAWDTLPSTTKTASHQYDQGGIKVIRMEVKDGGGLVATTTRTVSVTSNNPPTACFGVTPSSGTTSTTFNVNAGCSRDDTTTTLQVRWDWQNDGTWDTAYTTTSTASTSYATIGTKAIRVEVRDDAGHTTTSVNNVNVAADHPPYACFDSSPKSGTVSTTFNVDATCATDDYTPASGLQVRWDWETDGTWDTAYSTTKSASHSFPTVGGKTISVQVKDNAGQTSTTTQNVAVNTNLPPTPCFSRTPTSGPLSTVFDVNAGCSTDDVTPGAALQVRWDWEDNGWDTSFTTTKTASHQYSTWGTKLITIEVRDADGLVATHKQAVNIPPPNVAPNACFDLTPLYGTTDTLFTVDASCSTDDHTATESLEVRWDFESDGAWDTAYTTTKTATRQFTANGAKTILLQVRDAEGLTGNLTKGTSISNDLAPNACINANPLSGTTITTFKLDAGCSTDDRTAPASLRVRWDWENDGAWDTSLTTVKDASHQYTTTGSKTAKVEVRDASDHAATATQTLTVALANPSTCDQPGPDAYGYACSVVAHAFTDVTTTGTSLSLGDETVSGPVPIGFPFSYYGSTYSSLHVASNGFLAFLSPTVGCCDVQLVPDTALPNGIIAGYWEDLNPGAGGSVKHQTMGTAPNQKFIAQWTNVPHFGSSDAVTFQIVLFEGSSAVEVQASNAPTDGGTHVTGTESPTGAMGLRYAYGSYALSNIGIRFVAVAPPSGGTNTAPTLQAASVTPLLGSTDTMYTYSVLYKDLENTAPAYVHLVVDDTPFAMTPYDPNDSTYKDGKLYVYSTQLAGGSHSFQFRTRDASLPTVTQMGAGPRTEPLSLLWEDGENGGTGWTATDLWHRAVQGTSPHAKPFGGATSWWFGSDATGDFRGARMTPAPGTLTSPSIDLRPVLGNVELAFMSWYETTDVTGTIDRLQVEISRDGGAFNPLTRIMGERDHRDWYVRAIDLDAYRGSVIRVRFSFDASPASLEGLRGWYVDNIVVGIDSDMDGLPDRTELTAQVNVDALHKGRPYIPDHQTIKAGPVGIDRAGVSRAEVQLQLTHASLGDLRITIRNDDGESCTLWNHNTFTGSNTIYFRTDLHQECHFSKAAWLRHQNWWAEIVDTGTGGTGRVDDFRFYIVAGFDRLNHDVDGDLVPDGDEINSWRTSPLSKDIDNDNVYDGFDERPWHEDVYPVVSDVTPLNGDWRKGVRLRAADNYGMAEFRPVSGTAHRVNGVDSTVTATYDAAQELYTLTWDSDTIGFTMSVEDASGNRLDSRIDLFHEDGNTVNKVATNAHRFLRVASNAVFLVGMTATVSSCSTVAGCPAGFGALLTTVGIRVGLGLLAFGITVYIVNEAGQTGVSEVDWRRGRQDYRGSVDVTVRGQALELFLYAQAWNQLQNEYPNRWRDFNEFLKFLRDWQGSMTRVGLGDGLSALVINGPGIVVTIILIGNVISDVDVYPIDTIWFPSPTLTVEFATKLWMRFAKRTVGDNYWNDYPPAYVYLPGQGRKEIEDMGFVYAQNAKTGLDFEKTMRSEAIVPMDVKVLRTMDRIHKNGETTNKQLAEAVMTWFSIQLVADKARVNGEAVKADWFWGPRTEPTGQCPIVDRRRCDVTNDLPGRATNSLTDLSRFWLEWGQIHKKDAYSVKSKYEEKPSEYVIPQQLMKTAEDGFDDVTGTYDARIPTGMIYGPKSVHVYLELAETNSDFYYQK